RGDSLIDPTKFVDFPGLDDRQHVLHADVQRVMPTEVLRSLDDDARETESVGKCLELDSFDSDRERNADLLPALRSNLVRLYLLPPGRRSADEVSWEEEVMEMPKVIGILDAHLDLPRLRVAVEEAHRIRGMEGDRISAYRSRPGGVNMLIIRATALWLVRSDGRRPPHEYFRPAGGKDIIWL